MTSVVDWIGRVFEKRQRGRTAQVFMMLHESKPYFLRAHSLQTCSISHNPSLTASTSAPERREERVVVMSSDLIHIGLEPAWSDDAIVLMYQNQTW